MSLKLQDSEGTKLLIPNQNDGFAVPAFTLTERAQELYRGVAAQDDAHPVALDPLDADVQRLLRLQLLLPHPAVTGCYIAADPKGAGIRVGLSMHTQALELLAHAAKLPAQMEALVQDFAAARSPDEETVCGRYINGADAINARLPGFMASATREILTAQPGGARPAHGLDEALPRDLAALRRGVKRRILYQASARHDPATRAYVEAVTDAGAEVSTLEEPFDRMIVVDDARAVIPSLDRSDTSHYEYPVALAIQDPGMIAFVRRNFELYWRRASPWDPAHPTRYTPTVVTEQIEEVVRCLKEGMKQGPAARSLGISERTYAERVKRFKEQLGVDDLFRAGYRCREAEAAAAPESSDQATGSTEAA